MRCALIRSLLGFSLCGAAAIGRLRDMRDMLGSDDASEDDLRLGSTFQVPQLPQLPQLPVPTTINEWLIHGRLVEDDRSAKLPTELISLLRSAGNVKSGKELEFQSPMG